MLVLSRKKDEDVFIQTPEGRTIVIRVVEIIGDKVRLGFNAEPAVTIMRSELLTQEAKNGLERPTPGGPIHSAP